MAKSKNQIVRVEMLEDYTLEDGKVAKKGKFGSYLKFEAEKMIKSGAAKEVVTVSSYEDIVSKEAVVKKDSKPSVSKEEKSFN